MAARHFDDAAAVSEIDVNILGELASDGKASLYLAKLRYSQRVCAMVRAMRMRDLFSL